MKLEDKIKHYAMEIGIDLIGFASAESFERIGKIQACRKKRGHLSGFEEQDIEKRKNPLLTMENTKTIIAAAVGYYMPEEPWTEAGDEPAGEIARVAWGRDYHQILREKLKMLMAYIEGIAGSFDYKIYVDTGPLSDREVAFRAGIGWFGKNNMLITEKYGSWVFLGYALTSLELEPDRPLEKQCLDCQACIRACPGGALAEGFAMNEKRCLSYITQAKEEIDEEMKRKLANRIYGCDVCQGVCPQNRSASMARNRDFMPENRSHRPNLARLIQMTKKEFQEIYGETAAGWRGRNYFRRNAIIAAGNSKDPRLLPSLAGALQDESTMIRKHAAWAIHQIGQGGHELLRRHLSIEKEKEVIDLIKGYIEEAKKIKG
ncbi:tRNA epoxyqueuosine(34) reductase QueG [Thermotalea metallivorans]|uniref:Epoxyqueuosine reductase n=1 Tax=Thermotalea metallivorans TaxID=520762 RepID=A0A140LEH6_9FIRM|nr:tRNA epoxyqueuosine(34) reductase QueG [Thermotalea metallivorans]KXG78951.1 Epoxyqueuosine reductase [Thermotalea metallivorans]